VREVAHTLNVATVVSGSIRCAGTAIRIAVELVDAATGYQICSARYDRELRDVFALQDEMSRALVAALAPQLLGELRAASATARTGSLEAYDLYLRGRYFLSQRSRDGIQKGIAHFERALGLDPTFALAWTGIADSYTLLSFYGHLRPREAFPRVMEALRRALALDAALAEVHASLGIANLLYDWDWGRAERELREAIALKPHDAAAHYWYAIYSLTTGALDEAIREIQRARDLDPLSLTINAGMGTTLVLAGRYDAGIEQLRRTLELNPNFTPAYGFLGWAYYLSGRRAEAAEAVEKGMRLAGVNPLGTAYAKALSGERDAALGLLADIERAAATVYVQPIFIARTYAVLGEANAALAWLERGYDEREAWMVNLAIDPTFELLRSEPRFVRLLARLRLPQPRIDSSLTGPMG
jgi:tetratricopeptide (TPR) repeat protein